MAECAATGCDKLLDPSKLMCLKHWRMVSDETQKAVYQTWHRVHREPDAYREARIKAIAEVDAAEADRNNPNQGALDL